MAALRPLALCAAALLACARSQPPAGPVPLAMSPSQGTALEPLPVEISGRHFDAEVRTDLAAGRGELDARFSASLVPAGGGAPVALGDVTLTPDRTLRATVPPGIARGAYDLVVADAAGRTGVLLQAFRVVTSAENVAAFRLDVLGTPRAGVGFSVSLTAVDLQGLTVDGFDGSVTLSDASGTVTPGSLGPFLLGRYQGQVTVPAPYPADRLEVADALGHGGTSDPFDVVAGPPVALAFPDPPVAAAAGACSPPVPVELRDALGFAALAEAEIAAELQSAPPGLAFFPAEGCTAPDSSLVFAAGASRATFRFRAEAAGALAIRVLPATLPSASQTVTVSP